MGFALIVCLCFFFVKGSFCEGVFYKNEKDISRAYENSILEQLRVSSKFQCSHRCNRNKLCVDATFQQEQRICHLLAESKDVSRDKTKANQVPEEKYRGSLILTRITQRGILLSLFIVFY